MKSSTLTPLTYISKPHETSGLQSQREPDSIPKLWRFIVSLCDRSNKVAQIINQLSRDLKKLEARKITDFNFFPFKIYAVADDFRPRTDQLQYTSSINWRTVRVRGGYVLTQTVSTGSYVNGTDMMQNFSYTNQLPSSSVGPYDIQVPITQSQYWFWLQISGSAPSGSSTTGSQYWLGYGSNPSGSSDSGTDPWSFFPSASSNFIPIGYVDTLTSGSQNVAYVRQILTTDVISTGGGIAATGSYAGEWDPLRTYSMGQIAIISFGQNSGTYTYISETATAGNAPYAGGGYWDQYPMGQLGQWI